MSCRSATFDSCASQCPWHISPKECSRMSWTCWPRPCHGCLICFKFITRAAVTTWFFSPLSYTQAENFCKVTHAIYFRRLIQDKNPRKRIAQKLPTDSFFYCFWQSVVKCVVATKGASSSITHFTLGSRRINPSRALAGIKLKHKSRFVKEMY